MNRRTFLSLGALFPLTLSSQSFSLDQIRRRSSRTYENITDYYAKSFIKQRLPKIIINDKKMQAAISRISEPLFKVSNKDVKWKIFVVDEGQLNAYTLGAGLILVDKKLIKECKNETELASVIAHEIGHVHNGHAERRFATNDLYNQFKVKGFSQTDIRLLYKSYKRTAEHEADAFIIKAFLETDYSIQKASSFFHTLKKLYPSNKSVYECLFSTHPIVDERIQKIDKIASTFTQISYKKIDSKEFKYLKKRSKV